MALHLDDVASICASKETWKIAVKVVRLWTTQSFNNGKLPFSLEMVLVDAEGSKIQASVRKTLIYKFERLLTEGYVYCLSYFGVGHNSGAYRYTRHAFKLNFQYNTKVQQIKDSPINVLPYTFVPLSEIMFSEHDTNFLVDVIGILTGVGAEREYEKDGKKQKILPIELDADGVRIECALFGKYVDEMSSVLGSADMTNAVVVIQFAKVKIYQGKPALQNVYGATKISFNPDVEETSKIKEKFFEIYESGSQVLTQLQEPEKLSDEEDFLKAIAGKSIEEVKDLEEKCTCVILGTVKHINGDNSWWYTACKCRKKVYADEKMYFFEGCNRHITTVFPRYRLQIRVVDDKDSASLVIFDHEATSLIGKTCAELVDNNNEDSMPDEIKKLMDKTFLFKIEVNNSSTSKFEPSYRVKKISDDLDLIEHYKSIYCVPIDGVTPKMSNATPMSENKIEGIGSTLSKDLLSDFVVVGEEKIIDLTTNIAADLGYDNISSTCDDMQSVIVKNKLTAKIKKEKD